MASLCILSTENIINKSWNSSKLILHRPLHTENYYTDDFMYIKTGTVLVIMQHLMMDEKWA